MVRAVRKFRVSEGLGRHGAPTDPRPRPSGDPGRTGLRIRVAEDVALAIANSANLLMIGDTSSVCRVLDLLLPMVEWPVCEWRAGHELEAVLAAGARTVFLSGVERLTLDDQHRLSAWIERHPRRTHVISTAHTCLMPLVSSGAFDAPLYYRLNTVRIELR